MSRDPDAPFLELFARTAEFGPADRKYAAYVSFNARAVERGRAVARRLGKHLALQGSDALDVGTGSGGLAIALAEHGCRMTAIEPDPVRAKWAKTRFKGHRVDVRLIDAAGESLPFADESFDLVTLDSVLEHVQDASRVICEVSRVLRPGGLVYVVTPNKFSVFNILSDPHYEMFAVVLMPRWLGKFYVQRVRRVERGYWVYVIPTKRSLIRRFAKSSVLVEQLIPDGFEKLTMPDVPIRGPRPVRIVAKTAIRLGMTGLLQRIALAQYPAFVLLGRKSTRRRLADA